MATLHAHPRDIAALSAEEFRNRFSVTLEGLSDAQTKKMLVAQGANELPKGKAPGVAQRFLSQFKSPLILILVLVAALAPFIGEVTDALVILFVLLFNAVMGVIQEGRASQALAALDRAFISMATVVREGKIRNVPAAELVPGDVVILKEGDQVPADGRILESRGLRIDESSLTGESSPVSKTDGPTKATAQTPLGDLRNAAFRQTLVVAGEGRMLVLSTGADTEIGRIAATLKKDTSPPPLAKKIARLSRIIGIAVLGLSISLFFFGLATGREAFSLFATVTSLVVSLIPEGLPVVLTLVLARGVSRMAKRQAVVKRLHAVEGLGQVQVVCTDKTGTITENRLGARAAWIDGERFSVDGRGYEPEGKIRFGRDHVRFGDDVALDRLALACELLQENPLRFDDERGWHPSGDPIDAALSVFAHRYGVVTEGWKKQMSRPYSFVEKSKAASVFSPDGKTTTFFAGSPEHLLIEIKDSEEAHAALGEMAREGLRVIAITEKPEGKSMQLLGLVALEDQIREGVKDSVAWCLKEGIRVVMATGDHPVTALSIAKRVGIAKKEDEIITGAELESLTEQELSERLKNVRIFARISPEHKLRIIGAYRKQGLLTAMTGDGVNDAPALNAADIGVAMGKGGTDVAREAADLVLLDDNFSTIVAAIQEGRAVTGNVRKVLVYLLATSVGEALTLSFTLVGNLPLPLLPVQILWLNLVTDGFLTLALAMEPTHYAHHRATGELLDRRALSRILLLGGSMGALTIAVYLFALDRPMAELSTLCLTTLAVCQWFNAWSSRSETKSVFRFSLFSNAYLFAATLLVLILQLLAVYAPIGQRMLKTSPLSLDEWGLVALCGAALVFVDEIWKRVEIKKEA